MEKEIKKFRRQKGIQYEHGVPDNVPSQCIYNKIFTYILDDRIDQVHWLM